MKRPTRFWLTGCGLALPPLWLAYICLAYPDPAELAQQNPGRTAMMNLRLSEALARGKALTIDQRWVPLRAISPLLRESVRLSEDASFFEHDGFDFDEMEQALKDSVQRHRLRGASTISQQLIKNLYLSPSRNPLRKLTEAVLTYRLEQKVEKNRILELYLNIAEWGEGLFGVEAAAEHYFGESAFALTPAHAVLLASMLPLPLKTNPAHPGRWLLKRAKRLLRELLQEARISPEEYEDARRGLSGGLASTLPSP